MLIFASSGLSFGQSSIRQVDFKNFTYPLSGHLLGHDRLQWLGTSKDARLARAPIRLVNGSDLTKSSSFVMDGKEYDQYEGFTLQSVQYADLTGDGKEDAIVVLRYLTGGTQTTNYVYVYALDPGKPKLLAYCYTGDRAYSGLYKVYGEDGELVAELFDPKKAEGDCCSSGFVRTRYQWRDGRFEAVGAPEYGTVNAQ
ncbi:MAG: hypothetical protein ACRD3N_09695 [Terracidiphilus sp.]